MGWVSFRLPLHLLHKTEVEESRRVSGPLQIHQVPLRPPNERLEAAGRLRHRHLTRSAFLGEIILKAKTDGRIRPAATMENPPPSSHEEHQSETTRDHQHGLQEQPDEGNLPDLQVPDGDPSGQADIQTSAVCRITVRAAIHGGSVPVCKPRRTRSSGGEAEVR